MIPITRDTDGSVLDVGRKTRTIPPAIRRALEVRDRGCRFPDHSPVASGARGLRFAEGHHVIHWNDGGSTSLDNLVLLCRFHHRLVHEEGFRMEWSEVGERRPVFFDPRVRALVDWPPPQQLAGDPAAALVRAHLAAGIDPDALTASSRWKSQPDAPWSAYVRVLEALDSDEEEPLRPPG